MIHEGPVEATTYLPSNPRRWTHAKRAAVAIPLLGISCYLVSGAVAAHVLTMPVRDFTPENCPAKFGVAYEEVRLASRVDHVPIAGWYMPFDSSARAVVLVHGRNCSRTIEFGGRFVELGAMLQKRGLNVLMVDLRGHGESGKGRFSFGLDERRDVHGAVDWLLSRGFQPGSIGVLGVSLGAASAVGAAAEEPSIGALVTDSVFASLCPVLQAPWTSETHLPQFMLRPTLLMTRILFGIDLRRSQPVKEVGKIAPRPVLLIHSTTDQLVPISDLGRLQKAAPFAETWGVSGPEHARTFNAYPAEYAERVSQFFLKNLQ